MRTSRASAALLVALVIIGGGMAKTDERIGLIKDFAAYAGAFWSVASKSGERLPFVPNAAQRIVLSEIAKLEENGEPVRLIVVKARQQGISTLFTALLQHRCQTRAGHRAISIADRLELPRLWLRRAQQWHKETPTPIMPHLAASNALELFFDDIDSRLSIGSEGGIQPGMGMTLHDAHLSEVSSWQRYRTVTADLFPAIPQQPGTLVGLESTGESEGDDFYAEVMRAHDGQSDYKLVFLPFWLSSEYVMRTDLAEPDYTSEERELIGIAERWAKEHPEHAKIANFKGLTPKHIQWRRWVIANEFSGDIEVFRSRYPAQLSDAFLSVGSLAFPPDIVRHHKATAIQPIGFYRLERKGAKVEAVACDPLDGPCWRLYEPLHERADYAMGSDVAEGAVSDRSDERSERDYSVIMVLNRRNLATSALFHARIEPDKLGEEMLKAGEYFNRAWIAPEANAAGMATLAAIRGYTRLMPRSGAPDTQIDPADRPLDRLGWKTTPVTRDLLLDEYVRDCRPSESGDWEGRLLCLCPELAREEGTFVRTKLGKREHRPGCHDDVIFATAIALQVHRTCPRTNESPRPDLTAVMDELAEMVGAPEPAPSDAFVGGIDRGVTDEEADL